MQMPQGKENKMKLDNIFIRKATVFLIAVIMLLPGGLASAAEFYLKAGSGQLTMPDGAVVTIWGFALDTDGDFATDDGTVVTSPGPMLTVPAGDSTLIVYLKNNLAADPVSLTISGQVTTMTPVFVADAQGRQRVRSFTHEALPGGGEAVYTWNNFKPGTYLYQSGTHPALQVQMGLFGGVKKDAATKTAYTGITYDQEGILIFSEIDPVLHNAVASGNYGPGAAMTSTIDYSPKYFLYNGQAQIVLTGIVPTVIGGQKVLVRMLNAGLITRVPELIGASMTYLADDGNLLPYPNQSRNTLALLAGKTMDVLVTPSAGKSFALIDRRGYFSQGAADGNGIPTNQPVEGLIVPPNTGTTPSQPASATGGGGGCFIGSLFQ
jgi:FtsP/CotA-like multicopper oxidase with cupredoxin domain